MALLKTVPHTQEKVSLPWKSSHLPSSPHNYSQFGSPWPKNAAMKATGGWEVCEPKKVRSQEERLGMAKNRTYQMD